MANNTNEIIGFIGGAQTLVENFPMSVLEKFKGKRYDSIIAFILDILHELGVDDRVILKLLIQKLFDIPNFGEIDNDLMNRVSKLDFESDFINKLEDSTKVILSNVLTAILSCSIIPEIPNDKMDDIEGKGGDGGFITVPLSLIDYSGMLNVCPLNKVGQNYYNINSEENLNVNTLYKSYDLNAFMWYVLNRGISIPQKEKNKMVWDNRYPLTKENLQVDWESWYNSKTTNSGVLSEGTNKLYPIMQLERENYYDGEKRLRVYISSQTYFRDNTFNESIYKFNNDYLQSIRILSTKVILTNIVQELLGGLFLSNPINYSLEQTIIDGEINKIISNIIESDDTQIDDCYFSFSNEDYDKMLQQAELLRYNAKLLNSETSGAITIDSDSILDSLNDVSTAATSHEKIETITKTFYDIAAIPTKDASVAISDKLSLTYNNSWINEIIRSIVRPITRAIMSPQVMLLIVINLETTGIINLNSLTDKNVIMDLIRTKLIALIKSIIIYIKDKIVDFLLELFFNEIKPILNKYMAYLILEMLEDWLRLLRQVKVCLPKFNLKKGGSILSGIGYATYKFKKGGNILSPIDDVTYADIYSLEENKQNIPENTGIC